MGVDGVSLNFDDEAIREIARVAFIENENSENLGARRLHAVLENLLKEVLYEADDNVTKDVTISKEYVEEHMSGDLRERNLKKYIL
ncbi:MAG: hypothetical protein IJ226_03910 [Clostridia bacterium]|nr:hypothetical protein [Clostridia bacterium]